MVRVLKRHGPILERGRFKELCVAAGMNGFSFNAILMCSPVIAQYGRGVYGLLGLKKAGQRHSRVIISASTITGR